MTLQAPDLDPLARLQRAIGAMPLGRRISMVTAVGVGLAVALTSVAAYVTVRNQLQEQRDATLVNRARAAVSSPIGDPTVLVRVPAAALGAADLRIALARADNRFAARGPDSEPPIGPPEFAVARGDLDHSVRTASISGQQFRVVAVPAASGYALVVAQSTTETEETLRRLGLVLLVVGGLGVALAAWAGLLIGRAALRPVQRLTVAAEHVAQTERLDPIEVQGSDEIARLTQSFNAMLAALAASRDRQRALVADAGHELRTPLTSLRTNLDLLAQSESQGGLEAQDRAELLADVRAQVSELSDLVGDLVELAREGGAPLPDEQVDLADVVDRAVERVTRRAPGLCFRTDSAGWVLRGDSAGLERAVTNLLDNAAKWSPPDGTVDTRLRDGVLEVRDYGPGIAEADLPYVFDRFYRASEARTMPGSGLGLAIVRQAVERHGGTVSAARARGGGTLMTVRLPGQPAVAGTPTPTGSSA